MKFVLGFMNMIDDLPRILEGAVAAEEIGFDAALMPDHYDWGGALAPRSGSETLETWTTLTYVASRTKKIKLGTLVTPIPFRPPGMMAKIVSSLDVLSGGRVIFGVGAGWSEVEFKAYSEWLDDKQRVDKTIEGLELITRLWTEPKVDFQGKYYQAKDAVLEPKPVQKPYPKLLFGSLGSRMLALTGKYADLVFLNRRLQGDIVRVKQRVLQAASKHSREEKISFIYGEWLESDKYDPKEHAKLVEEAARLRADYFYAYFPEDSFIPSMKLFAREIMPSYS